MKRYKSIYIGYGNAYNVNFNSQPYPVSYHLNDFSSRDNNTKLQVLEVPNNVNNPNEFFLIAYRSKESSYDRVMWGDTAKNDCFRDINPDYGKGVYIYHNRDGYNWNTVGNQNIDQECADGLFNWEFQEYFNPDWSNTQPLPFFKKTSISRDPDQSFGTLYGADEKSMAWYYQDKLWTIWGSIGKKHTCVNPPANNNSCNESTDRIYTNNQEIWTSRACKGDRWDAWRKGYNEVFSPYSSPSTCQWNSSELADVFIWLYNQDENGVDFKIYKTGFGGYNLSQILAETPPSRPMGLILSYTECIDGFIHPVLKWEHNLEPDMIDPNHPGVKRYRVGKAYSNVNSVPGTYGGCADQYFNASTNPEFIDYSTYIYCEETQNPMMIRYIVKAVDKDQWESVPSDFVSTPADGVYLPDNFKTNTNIPKSFSLHQNYPNPFNPVTNIKYDLPKDIFVSVKVYDLLGREIKTIVNEFKQAGSYLVSFNGAEFASGVYFYRIQAGSFTMVKRMVLINK